MKNPTSQFSRSIAQSAEVIAALDAQVDAVAKIAEVVVTTLRDGGKVLTAGYGGSAADAMHMAEELVGQFDRKRRPLPACCLTSDPTLLTCIANDYGYEHWFPRQVEALAQRGDLLVLFSTSGNSPGLIESIELARQRGAGSIALLGKGGGALDGRADHQLVVASDTTARIQEAHTLILHLILEAVDAQLAD